MFATFLIFLVLLSVNNCLEWIKIDPNTHNFIDSTRSTYMFHGVNAVYKVPPWIPNTETWSATESLTDRDIKDLASWGFNVVRLGVMWPGVMPSHLTVNETYLDEMEKIINKLGDQGIYTIIDCHQDLLSRYYCGEGFPDYYINTVTKGKDFPKPLFWIKMKFEEDTDYPELDSCHQKAFSTYHFTDQVGKAFEDLYTEGTPLNNGFKAFWEAVSSRFHSSPNVLAYDLLNEPWAGDIFSHPFHLLPGHASEVLEPFYTGLHKAIRNHDENHIILYEPATNSLLGSNLNSGPGGPAYNHLQGFSYHIYCPLVNKSGSPYSHYLCQIWDMIQMLFRKKDLINLNTAGLITEYGALDESEDSLKELERVNQLAEMFNQGVVYWTYKDYHDITTMNRDGSENLYYADGRLQQNKVQVLSRTYARRVGGVVSFILFNRQQGIYELRYKSAGESLCTKVFLSEGMREHDFQANVDGEVSYTGDQNQFLIFCHTGVKKGTQVQIKISKK
jgi:endoglycosylceramidase